MIRFHPHALAAHFGDRSPITLEQLLELDKGRLSDDFDEGKCRILAKACALFDMLNPLDPGQRRRAGLPPLSKSLKRAAADVVQACASDQDRSRTLTVVQQFGIFVDLHIVSGNCDVLERSRRGAVEREVSTIAQEARVELEQAFEAFKSAASVALERGRTCEQQAQRFREERDAEMRRLRAEREELELQELARVRTERKLAKRG